MAIDWIDAVFGQRAPLNVEDASGTQLTPPAYILQIAGAGASVAYDGVGARYVATVPGVAAALASGAPPAIAAAGAVGVATTIARSDHTHAHGAQTDGTMHAAAIAGGASGFMTGAQATLLANATSAATPTTIAMRDGSGNTYFNAVYLGALALPALSTPAAPAGNGAPLLLQANAATGGAGHAGGYVRIVTGAGGSGADAAGDIELDVGAAVSGISQPVSIQSSGVEFMKFFKDSSGVSTSVLANSTTRMRVQSGSLIHNDGNAGTTGDTLTCSFAHAGASSFLWGAGTTVSYGQSQHATAAGNVTTYGGQRGASGFAGGDVAIVTGLPGTSGTNLAGNFTVDLGATVSGVTARHKWLSNGNAFGQLWESSAGVVQLDTFTNAFAITSNGWSATTTAGAQLNMSTIIQAITPYYVTFNAPSVQMLSPANASPYFEFSQLASNQRVVSIGRGAAISTTNMPAGSGDGVVNIANATVEPTISCDSTGVVFYGANSGTQIRVRETNGFVDCVNTFDSGGGGLTRERMFKQFGHVSTAAASITTISGVIKASDLSTLSTKTGVITLMITITGRNNAGSIFYKARRSTTVSIASSTLAILQTETIGTDFATSGVPTYTIDISTDLRVRVTPPDSGSYVWAYHAEVVTWET